MRRRAVIAALAGAALCAGAAFGQSVRGRPLVGVLFPGQSTSSRIEALLQGLRDHGYVDGRNIAVRIGAADFDRARLAPLADEFVRSGVDVLVTSSSAGVLAAQAATRTIPIVFSAISDPVTLGVAASLARPGGNVTGVTLLAPEIAGKRLALIKEALPAATRVAVLQNPGSPSIPSNSRDFEAVAHSLGLELRVFGATSPAQFDAAMAGAAAWSANAVLSMDDPLFENSAVPLAAAAARHALPLMCSAPDMGDAGCLFTYGVDIIANWRHAASFVDKIIKGAKPADLPIENPTRFVTVLNLKTASALRIVLPTSMLLRADKVIE
jgi:putative tryptophan/tyrosine transport system substrate-binding protein